ncbi:MAG: hypothetical protein AABY15_02715 [Nanoarchaeota archaeon]
MEDLGKINVYTCQSCSKKITTQNKAEGVTPFMIGCDAEGCEGMAHSAFYRVAQDLSPIDYYWVKMSDEELREESKRNTQEIVAKSPDWAKRIKEDLEMEPEDFIFEQNKEHSDNGGLFMVKNG